MGASKPSVRVAVTQHEPVWLDLEGTVKKTIAIIEEAAKGGARIVVSIYVTVRSTTQYHLRSRPVDFDLGVKYVQNSLALDSLEMKSICTAAAENSISVSLGFSERSGESIYISQALIDDKGNIRVARRKFKPTHMERTVFGDASGECLAQVATIEGCRNLAQTYAMESQAFVLHVTSALGEAGIQAMGTAGAPIMGSPSSGSSAVIGPDGRILSQPEPSSEKLIYADLDLNLVTKTRTFADAADSRPDLLWLGADPKSKPMVRLVVVKD
nr:arylacetonitrilase [Quercus suber]